MSLSNSPFDEKQLCNVCHNKVNIRGYNQIRGGTFWFCRNCGESGWVYGSDKAVLSNTPNPYVMNVIKFGYYIGVGGTAILGILYLVGMFSLLIKAIQ